jgi:hypothetical protein
MSEFRAYRGQIFPDYGCSDIEQYEYCLDKHSESGWKTVLTLYLQAEHSTEEKIDYLYRHKSKREMILHVLTYRDTPANFALIVDHGGEHWINVNIEGSISDYYVSHDDGETWQSITLYRAPIASEYTQEELPCH